MLELHELQVFLVAAETENFSEAGRILQVSQPAVSAQIQALEQRLKTQLFDRTGRNIKLNDVGVALVPLVRSLLKQSEQIEEFVASCRGEMIGSLVMGCSTASGKYILPRLFSRFLDLYPNVQITCQVGPRGKALDCLCNREIDLAVSSLCVPRRDIEYRHFLDDQLVLIVPVDHPWAARSSIAPEELTEYELVSREASSGTSITLNRDLMAHDMSLDMLRFKLIVWNTEAIVHAVQSGIGPAFVSRVAAKAALNTGEIVELPVEGFALMQPLYMACYTRGRASEVRTAFWEFAFAPENEDLRQLIT
jgi:DNA-binding transcriptional LysR family regulator